jgi:hypothetical protein
MRSSLRAAGLIGIIGLVVGTLTYSLVGLANNANFVAHDELLGELGLRCSEPSDHVDGIGSCAPPLLAADFAAKRATLTLTMQPQADGTTTIDYTFENRTATLRSFVWRKVELTTPSAHRVGCLGDDSTRRYAAPPSVPQRSGYGCPGTAVPGRYVVNYGGVEVASLEIGA